MEHVESLTDYEKLKKAEMAVVSVWPYVQKLMQLENEVSQLKAKIDDKKNLIIGIVLSIIPLAFLIGIPMVIVWVVNYSKIRVYWKLKSKNWLKLPNNIMTLAAHILRS